MTGFKIVCLKNETALTDRVSQTLSNRAYLLRTPDLNAEIRQQTNVSDCLLNMTNRKWKDVLS